MVKEGQEAPGMANSMPGRVGISDPHRMVNRVKSAGNFNSLLTLSLSRKSLHSRPDEHIVYSAVWCIPPEVYLRSAAHRDGVAIRMLRAITAVTSSASAAPLPVREAP